MSVVENATQIVENTIKMAELAIEVLRVDSYVNTMPIIWMTELKLLACSLRCPMIQACDYLSLNNLDIQLRWSLHIQLMLLQAQLSPLSGYRSGLDEALTNSFLESSVCSLRQRIQLFSSVFKKVVHQVDLKYPKHNMGSSRTRKIDLEEIYGQGLAKWNEDLSSQLLGNGDEGDSIKRESEDRGDSDRKKDVNALNLNSQLADWSPGGVASHLLDDLWTAKDEEVDY